MELLDQNGCVGFAGGGWQPFEEKDQAKNSENGTFQPFYRSGVLQKFINCYYQVGGFTYRIDDVENDFGEGFLCARITATGDADNPALALVLYETFAEMQEEQKNLNYVIIPLFQMERFDVKVDMRRMPTTGIVECFKGKV